MAFPACVVFLSHTQNRFLSHTELLIFVCVTKDHQAWVTHAITLQIPCKSPLNTLQSPSKNPALYNYPPNTLQIPCESPLNTLQSPSKNPALYSFPPNNLQIPWKWAIQASCTYNIQHDMLSFIMLPKYTHRRYGCKPQCWKKQ